MKPGIHPKYEQTTIRCACGEVIAMCLTASILPNLR